jgi:membrane-bound metal-dependent hydrolase YbcI (DUF457 family)
MPSPIGHALAGAAIAWSMRSHWKLAALCAGFACLPDIDLLYLPAHRIATHSLPTAILVTIIAVAVTGRVKGDQTVGQEGKKEGRPSCLPGLAVGLAWSSHVLMDWLGADASVPYGIQLLWPFSDRWYVSGWDLFPGTERRQPLGARATLINVKAAAQELAIMGSLALAVWWAMRTRRSRGPISGPGDPQPPSGAAADTRGISDRPNPRAGR